MRDSLDSNAKIEAAASSDQMRFIQWDSDEELREKLLDLLVEELKLGGLEDEEGFEGEIVSEMNETTAPTALRYLKRNEWTMGNGRLST